MKIKPTALSLSWPKPTKENIINLIKPHSSSAFLANLNKILGEISTFIDAKTHFWFNKQLNEKPIDHRNF